MLFAFSFYFSFLDFLIIDLLIDRFKL